LTRVGIVSAVIDGSTCGVTEENRIARFANHLVKPIDFVPRTTHEVVERLTKLVEFSGSEDPWRFGAIGVNAVLGGRPLPGIRDFVDAEFASLSFRNEIDKLGMPRRHIDRACSLP
jgi:hypothetical protein